MRFLEEARAMASERQFDPAFGEALAKAGILLDQADEALLALDSRRQRWIFESAALLRAHFTQLCTEAWRAQQVERRRDD